MHNCRQRVIAKLICLIILLNSKLDSLRRCATINSSKCLTNRLITLRNGGVNRLNVQDDNQRHSALVFLLPSAASAWENSGYDPLLIWYFAWTMDQTRKWREPRRHEVFSGLRPTVKKLLLCLRVFVVQRFFAFCDSLRELTGCCYKVIISFLFLMTIGSGSALELAKIQCHQRLSHCSEFHQRL